MAQALPTVQDFLLAALRSEQDPVSIAQHVLIDWYVKARTEDRLITPTLCCFVVVLSVVVVVLSVVVVVLVLSVALVTRQHKHRS